MEILFVALAAQNAVYNETDGVIRNVHRSNIHQWPKNRTIKA